MESVEGGSEALDVEVGSSYAEHEVVGGDRPLGLGGFDGVEEGGVDVAAGEGPPADLAGVDSSASAAGFEDAAHGVALVALDVLGVWVEVGVAFVVGEDVEDGLGDVEAEDLGEVAAPGGFVGVGGGLGVP